MGFLRYNGVNGKSLEEIFSAAILQTNWYKQMNSIVPILTSNEEFRNEFTVNEFGQSFCSKRAVARMAGKSLSTIQNVLQSIADRKQTSKVLAPFAGQVFQGDRGIPDTLATALVQYYAFKGSETAQDTAILISTYGLRNIAQEKLGWKATVKTQRFLLAEPRDWTKVFENQFYDQLSRLTGLSWCKKTHRRPARFGQLTKMFVYDYLDKDVYEQIKRTQRLHGGHIYKMHQFIGDEALTSLKEHLTKVTGIMESSESLTVAKQRIYQYATRQYQMTLFG